MITEKEIIDDITILKDKIWMHSHPMLKGVTNTKLWGEIYSKFEDILSTLNKNGIKIK